MSLTSAATLATLDQTGPRRITDLAVAEGVTQPAMTVLVRVMEESGLVERRAIRPTRSRRWQQPLPALQHLAKLESHAQEESDR